ncbi:signal peptidase II [Candidatus Uhrbacteria bacterium]|nr:signal peptidase II [Candidatus Uhrbacteria bacterium]
MQKDTYARGIVGGIALLDLGWRFFLLETAGRVYRNMGAGFSLPVPAWIILPLSAVLIASLIIFVRHVQEPLPRTALFAVIVGALSNLTDRIVHGFTTDYIFLPHGAVINAADILIVCGIAVFLFSHPQPRIDK